MRSDNHFGTPPFDTFYFQSCPSVFNSVQLHCHDCLEVSSLQLSWPYWGADSNGDHIIFLAFVYFRDVRSNKVGEQCWTAHSTTSSLSVVLKSKPRWSTPASNASASLKLPSNASQKQWTRLFTKAKNKNAPSQCNVKPTLQRSSMAARTKTLKSTNKS